MDGALEIARQLPAVVFVLGLASAAAWWLKKGRARRLVPRAPRGRMRQLELVERLVLGPQQSLCLVRCGDRLLAFVLTPAGAGLLTSWTAEEPAIPVKQTVAVGRAAGS